MDHSKKQRREDLEDWAREWNKKAVFIDKHRNELIRRVCDVDAILDHLKEEKVITKKTYREILCKTTSQAKMRALMKQGNIHSSPRGKAILYEVLLEEEPFLMEKLQGPVKDSCMVHQESREEDSDETQRGCECCTEVPDTSHWVLVEPEVSTENSGSTYSLSSAAGSYECLVSRLRWSCSGPVILQYHFMDSYVIAEELAQIKCNPAGPLMDIKLMLGELDEIHLPHFLCLGSSQSALKDAVKVLHKQDSGASLETCELTRHHARIVQPSLSLLLTVCYYMDVSVHCELLLFCTSTAPLKLHVYLVPKDPAHIQAIHQKEKGEWIDKPGKVGLLRLNTSVCVRTTCQSKIQPKSMDLWPLSTSNYCEVYMEHPNDSFDIVIVSPPENGKTVCERSIYSIDYQSASKHKFGDKHFIYKNFSQLVEGVSNVDPVLDRLLEKDVINQEDYSEIRRQKTSYKQMRALLKLGRIRRSSTCKDKLYEVLMEVEPHLMEEIEKGQ